MNSRCQVDLIDLQTQPDDEFKFILNYQDHLTKFVVLRPLKSKTALEVANQLMDILSLLGAPFILQCDNGREFANRIIEELANMWDGMKIIHGTPRHSQSQGLVERVNQDVQNMLTTWLITNQTTKWSEGLKYVQLMKNRANHESIKQSPCEAMFGSKMKLDLETCNLPKDSIQEVETEEELETLIQEVHIASSLHSRVSDTLDIEAEDDEIKYENNEILELDCILSDHKKLIDDARKKARDNLESQAIKMCNFSKDKFPPAVIGDNVRVSIPDIDRGKTDPKNLICVVLSKDDNTDLYKLGIEEGVLKQSYSRNEFVVCEQKFLSGEEISQDVQKSLREIVGQQSLTGGQGFKKCTCKGG
ncbi:KRAB-A domain-containing protein 2-like [Ctenocephalides felis]|uniref:KRAB-A domain-containing protein 2-like n=1 Tax=Ctenocephalides felis TaxID=7515 RepID=UPI000E6E32EC|nr:KRAB-A domain-containing protein 2-like [Ctenocephalides felis]